MSNLKKRIQAFGHAFTGWKWYWSGFHAKVHTIAAITAISMAWYFDISATHWTIICLCIASVIAAEMFNSALEEICDQLHPEQSPGIGRAKDMAAGAVLFLAIGTLVVGLVIFHSYIFTVPS
ncbi:MAG: diacylglycerol kinase family protein [Flavobacteriales bacterium]